MVDGSAHARFACRRLFAGAALAGLLLGGCSTAVKEFFGVDEAESAASITDLGQYHDPLVLLNRANRLFDKRNYLEAALTYERFLELHGLHRQADYAQFRVGLSHLKQFRSVDRDIEPVAKAVKAFQRFLAEYPNSLYAAEAQRRLGESRRHLADAELSVGRFYYRRQAYPAAIHRLEGVIKDYGDLPAAEAALYLLGRVYEDAGQADHARAILQRLLTSYPNSGYRQQAQEQLARLNGHSA
ncbi:MAG: outer membrane protein assembly factor BamD [Nitrospirota bacterium]